MIRSPRLLYTPAMAISAAVMTAIVLAGFTAAQERVSFSTPDGGLVYADVYGKGERGVVLAHGGGLRKESWEKQGRALAQAGFRSVALDFRGEGKGSGLRQDFCQMVQIGLEDITLQHEVGEFALSNDRNQARCFELFEVMREGGCADGLTVVHRCAGYSTVLCANLS